MEYTKEPIENMTFTNHILERYIERTMGKTGTELKQFLVQNEDQVKEKILKLYEYSELFWYGKIKDHDFTYFTINRDGWVFVIDKNKTTLVTIYKVDLGLSTEFNKKYIEEIKNYVKKESEEITQMKTLNDNMVGQYNTEIRSLEEQIKILNQEILILKNKIKLMQDDQQLETDSINLKEKKLHQKIEKFIGAKIFEK